MRSAVDLTLPLIDVEGIWFHAYTTGRAGRALRGTPRGSLRPSGFPRTRFNPGDLVDPNFETLYLALDPETALFEKRAWLGNPYGGPSERLPSETFARTAVLTSEVSLRSVVDLTDPTVQTLLETTAQELTGDWAGYERRGAEDSAITVRRPIGMAPTQQLGWELFSKAGIQGIKTISAQVPTTCSIVVFTHKLPPGSLTWHDPNTGRWESYPD